MKIFAERLKELRQKNNLTQQEIAERLQVTQGAYQKWETGRNEPCFEHLIELSIIFDVSVDSLLGVKRKKGRGVRKKMPTELGQRLYDLRYEANIKQIDLARKLGCSSHVPIVNYENGKVNPSYNSLLAYAKIFDVSVDWIMGLSDVKNRTD